MSQLNLKQILSGDNLSTVVDKLNYNFDQIILNGGGPQGLRGILGGPGLPGPRGLIGNPGPQGEHGTYVFAGDVSPTVYQFDVEPRVGDIFLETHPNSLTVYEYQVNGEWLLIKVISAASSAFIQLIDQNLDDGVVSIANDPNVAGKLFIGSKTALEAGSDPDYFIDDGSPARPTLVESLTDNSTLTVASERRQLRILSNGLEGCTGTNNPTVPFTSLIRYDRGGISHTLEKRPSNEGLQRQIYVIENDDDYGDKYFTLKLNKNQKTLLHGDLDNKLGVGVKEFDTLKAQLTVNESLLVGSSDFSTYSVFLNNRGIITQGNLSVGAANNSYFTGSFYNSGNGANDNQTNVIIDVDSSQSFYRESKISISSDVFQGRGNIWSITHTADNRVNSIGYRNLTIGASLYGLTGGSGRGEANAMSFGLTAGNNFGTPTVLPNVGIGGIYDPYALVEIGTPYHPNHVSIGQMGGGGDSFDASSYIGFNLHRSPVTDSWLKRGDSANNSGKAIWSGMYDQSLNISFIPSSGGANVTGLTDSGVVQNTRVSIFENGAIHTDNTNRTYSFLNKTLGLYIGFGPTGTVGNSEPGTVGNILSTFRSPVAYFGKWAQDGAPVIYATNGVNQTASLYGIDTVDVLPQYAFSGAYGGNMGMYLAQGGTGNTETWGTKSYQVGLATQGISAVSAHGDGYLGAQVGINQRNPRERFQISDKLVFHDESRGLNGISQSNTVSYFGYNVYSKWDGISKFDSYRMAGSAGDKQGYAKIAFPEFGSFNASTISRFNTVGTKIELEVGNLGSVNDSPTTTLPYDSTPGTVLSTYRGVIIAPPPQGPSTHRNMSNYVPQVGVGIKLDSINPGGGDSGVSGRRGTLAVAAQMRMKPNTLGPLGYTQEDIYNLGLYNHEGFPVAAIGVAGGNTTNTTRKTFEIDFIGNNGDVLFEDATLLYASADNNLANKFQRTAQFGDSFRLGINTSPNELSSLADINSLYSGNGHDVASLTVAAGLKETFHLAPAQYNPAAIFKGSVIIDQTPFDLNGDGGNNALWFKAGGITGGAAMNDGGNNGVRRTSPAATNTYAGDWGIQYAKVTAVGWGSEPKISGLSFFRKSQNNTDTKADIPLFISDAVGTGRYSSVGIGTQNFTYSSSGSGNYGSHGFNGNSTTWSATVAGIARLAVNGVLACSAIINYSDKRLKQNINSLDSTLKKIMLLNPVDYEFIDTPGVLNKGFIAQDILEIYPEIVRKFNDPEFEDGKLTLDYNSFIPILTKGIQEQQDIIEKQAETIKNLEDRLSKIEELLSKM